MLALWEFFWTEADWTPAPSTTSATGASNAGGGGFRDRNLDRAFRDIAPLSDDYWQVRERYIRRLTRPQLQPPQPQQSPGQQPQQPLPSTNQDLAQAHETLVVQRAIAIEQAYSAQTRADLLQLGTHIAQLTQRLQRYEAAALELLLLAAATAAQI